MTKKYSLRNIADKAEYLQEDSCPDISVACDDLKTEMLNKSSEYVFDYIDEIADSNISIYTKDLIEQCATPEFQDYVNNSIAAFGFPDGDNPMIRLYQQAQFVYFQQSLFDNLNAVSKNAVLDYLSNQSIVLEGNIDDVENAFNEITEYVKEYFDDFDVEYKARLSDIIDGFDSNFNVKINELSEEYHLCNVKITEDSDDDRIRCLFIPVGETPREIFINKDNSLKELQGIVGGYIEALPLQSKDDSQMIDLICNEEGKILNLPVNRYIRESIYSGDEKDIDVLDYIAGNCVIIAANEEGEWVSVSNENYSHYEGTFHEPENVFVGSLYLTDEYNCVVPHFETEIPERSKYNSRDDFDIDDRE